MLDYLSDYEFPEKIPGLGPLIEKLMDGLSGEWVSFFRHVQA